MKNQTQETNYCAHAIDDIAAALVGDVSADARETLTELRQGLQDSLHFRLPDSGQLFQLKHGSKITDSIRDYCPHLRLPFAVTALEFSLYADCASVKARGDAHYDASILLLREIVNREGSPAILIRPMVRACYGSRKTWIPEDYAAVVNAETLTIEALWQTESGKIGSSEDASEMLQGPLTVMTGFIAALSCSNSVTADAPPPNAALNEKRKRSGKTPFFSYKVLTLDLDAKNRTGAGTGSHASPRVHLRRGHVRRLADRTVWVNAAVVGDKRNGFIHKGYRLT